MLLAAVSVLLIVAPFVESQEQPAKQGPGRVKLIDTVTGNREFITLLAFTNGGKTLVSLSNDYGDKPRGLEIKSWDVATRKVKATISQTEPAYGCALSPDGNTLAVGLYAPRGRPTAIRLFDLRKEKKPRDIKVDDSAFMSAVAISSDGKTLAWVVSPEEAGSPVAKKIRLWNLPAGKLTDALDCFAFAYLEGFGLVADALQEARLFPPGLNARDPTSGWQDSGHRRL